MKEKIFAMKCLNPKCGKVLVYLGDLGSNALGVIDNGDFKKRFHTDNKGSYIECKYCGKKNALYNTKNGDLPVLRLSHIREE